MACLVIRTHPCQPTAKMRRFFFFSSSCLTFDHFIVTTLKPIRKDVKDHACVCACEHAPLVCRLVMNPSVLNSPPLTCHSATEVAQIAQPNASGEPREHTEHWASSAVRVDTRVSGFWYQDTACEEMGLEITTRRSIFYFIKPPLQLAPTPMTHAHTRPPSHNPDCFPLWEQEPRNPDSHQWRRYQQSHYDIPFFLTFSDGDGELFFLKYFKILISVLASNTLRHKTVWDERTRGTGLNA